MSIKDFISKSTPTLNRHNCLVFNDWVTSAVTESIKIGDIGISLTFSGNVYITYGLPENAPKNNKRIYNYSNIRSDYIDDTKKLVIFNGIHTSPIKKYVYVNDMCVCLTESGIVYITLPFTIYMKERL